MLIYVAHPFNNEGSNREKVARIIDNLIYEYPEHNWLSPIHATGEDRDFSGTLQVGAHLSYACKRDFEDAVR